jgi:ABC-type uncharacterized transport system permease subunit
MDRNIYANGFGAICYDVLAHTRSPWGMVAPSCRPSVILIALNYNYGGTRFVSHRKVPPECVLVIAHLIILSIAAQIRYRIGSRSWKLVACSCVNVFPLIAILSVTSIRRRASPRRRGSAEPMT